MYNKEKQKNIAIILIFVIIFLIILSCINLMNDKELDNTQSISQGIEKIYNILVGNYYIPDVLINQ